jgi:hypothetical protein
VKIRVSLPKTKLRLSAAKVAHRLRAREETPQPLGGDGGVKVVGRPRTPPNSN